MNKTADKVIKKRHYNYDCNRGSYIYCPEFISSAYARYFNCVTRIANGNGTMTLENVKGCYYNVFQGARDTDADGNKIR
ncbi:MAG: hypothetical protein WBZ50_02835 [Nitrososphaeraceae archaeon]